MAACDCDNEEPQNNVHFSPPLFRQRYRSVTELIRKHGKGTYSKIVDLGCSNMGLFLYLKSIRGVKEILFVDIDYATLKAHCPRLNPIPADFLQKRNAPLAVTVLCADARFLHAPLRNTDVVLMVEFIEHLEKADLSRVVRVVFSGIMPKLIIVTTPNRDFNKHFPNLPEGKFRHADHKFEFSHEEFVSWCKCAISNFSYYEVSFSGCGGPIEGSLCTQTAIFTRKQFFSKVSNAEVPIPSSDNRYDALLPEFRPCHKHCRRKRSCNVVHEVRYPYDTRTSDERQIDAVMECWCNFRSCLRSCLDRFLDLAFDNLQDASDQNTEKQTPPKEMARGEMARGEGFNEKVVQSKQSSPIFISRSPKPNKPQKAASQGNDGNVEDENGKIFVKLISDVNSLKEIRRPHSDVIFLLAREESFYVPLRTFLNWARSKMKESKIEKAFNVMQVEKLETEHETLYVVRFAKPDSEEEPDDHLDSPD